MTNSIASMESTPMHACAQSKNQITKPSHHAWVLNWLKKKKKKKKAIGASVGQKQEIQRFKISSLEHIQQYKIND